MDASMNTAANDAEEVSDEEEQVVSGEAGDPEAAAAAAAKRAAKNKAKKARAKAAKAAAGAAGPGGDTREGGRDGAHCVRSGASHLGAPPHPLLTPACPSVRSPGCSKASGSVQQTTPPSVPVRSLFPAGVFPEGETQPYRDDNTYRTTSAECRERERLEADMYNSVRQAAEVHRQVRKYVQTIAQPGIKLFDLCERLEACVRQLIEEKGLEVRLVTPPRSRACTQGCQK